MKLQESINNYVNRSKQEAILRDIETSVNAIVIKTSTLPYHKQVDVVCRILKGLQERESQLIDETNLIGSCIEEINNIKTE